MVINTRGVIPFDRAAPPAAGGVGVLLDRHNPLPAQHTRVTEMHECRRPPLEVKLGLGAGEEDVHIVVVGAVQIVVKTAQ
jgi:hypothetical protein